MPQAPLLHVLPSPALQVTTVRGSAALAALVGPWRQLETRARRVPLAVEVLQASGRLAEEPEARVVVVFDQQGIQGLWPLAVDRLGPVSIARRLGGPLQAYDGLTLARDAPARRVAAAAWREVAGWADVDVLKLDALVTGDPLLDQAGLADWARTTRRTTRVRLAQDRDLLTGRSKQRRKSVRRRRRKLEALGTVTFRRLTRPTDREQATHQAIAAKLQWLDEQGAPSPVLRSRGFQQGLGAAALLGPAASRVEVFQLELDGEGVAWELGHVDGDTFCSFVGAYRADLAPLGLGVHLTLETAGWCARQGLQLYDFLPPTTPFKQGWGDHERAVSRVVRPLRPRGRLVVPAVREGRALAKQAWERFVPTELAQALLAG